jgi:hypothetical protein
MRPASPATASAVLGLVLMAGLAPPGASAVPEPADRVARAGHSSPSGIDVGPGGALFVTDGWNDRIQVFGD